MFRHIKLFFWRWNQYPHVKRSYYELPERIQKEVGDFPWQNRLDYAFGNSNKAFKRMGWRK